MKLSRLLFLSLILLPILNPLTSFAQETTDPGRFDATVSPVFFDFSVQPGQTINNSVRIRNNSNTSQVLTIKIDQLGGDDTGELTIKEAPGEESLSWLSIENNTVTAPPNEWVTVPFTITVPENAAYGYYWALSFNSPEAQSDDFTGARLNASLVVPILLNVNKEGAKTEGKIVEFKKDQSWYEYLPVKFTTVFENTGNVHIRPKGNIFIKDFTGRQVAVLEVNENGGAILPQIKRGFESIWDDGFVSRVEKVGPDGKVLLDDKGNPQTELKFRFDKILDFRIGKYTATVLMVLSTDTRDIPFEQSISFFVFPWKIVIGIVIFVIFAMLGFVSSAKTLGQKVRGIFKRNKK